MNSHFIYSSDTCNARSCQVLGGEERLAAVVWIVVPWECPHGPLGITLQPARCLWPTCWKPLLCLIIYSQEKMGSYTFVMFHWFTVSFYTSCCCLIFCNISWPVTLKWLVRHSVSKCNLCFLICYFRLLIAMGRQLSLVNYKFEVVRVSLWSPSCQLTSAQEQRASRSWKKHCTNVMRYCQKRRSQTHQDSL